MCVESGPSIFDINFTFSCLKLKHIAALLLNR